MKRAAQVIHIGLAKRFGSFLLALIALLWRLVRHFTPRRAGAERTVLILEPFGLGDVITHEPLIRALQANGVTVTFCARPEWRTLFPNVRWVDSKIAWGRHSRAEKYPLSAYVGREFRSLLRELSSAARGTTGVDTRGDIRSVVLLYLAGCRRVITLSNYLGSDLIMPSFAGELIPFSPNLRRWELNLRFAERLGANTHGITPPMFPHLKRDEVAMNRQAALIPIAPWQGKWWQPDKWQAVVAGLLARGLTCTGLCGPGQSELARQQLGESIAMIECESLVDWAQQLQQFECLITLDTGPMHLADALDVPLAGLFGQGQLPLWAPGDTHSIVISHQSDPDFQVCAPIEANSACGREFMGRIAPDEVLQAIDKILANKVNG